MPYTAATVVMGDRFAHPRKQKIREHSNGFCMKLYAQRMDPIWNRVKIMYALIKLTSPGKVIKLNQQAWIIKPIWVQTGPYGFFKRAVRILFGIA